MATATRASTAASSATTFAFKNWGGSRRCRPLPLHKRITENELVALVRAADDAGEHVKVVGAGHSFTDIACTDGHMIGLDDYRRGLEGDIAAATIKVQAGITIHDLGEVLAGHGLAQANLGDIAYQSIAGAISTATHGTGQRLGNIATQVKALSLVTADGSIVECSADKNTNVYNAARVSLGALGIISTVTLQCVPAFVLRSVQRPRLLHEVLEEIDDLTGDNQHFEFFWIPHSDRALAITNNRTDSPPHPPGRISAYF